MKKLGILFIIAGIILGICAIINLSPGDLERKLSEEADFSRSLRHDVEKLNRLEVLAGQRPTDYGPSREAERRSDSAIQRSEREQRLSFYAISAVVLGVTGLILIVSQLQPAGDQVPAPLPTTANSKPTPPAPPPPPPKTGRGIYLHMRGEVTGPYTTSEVEGYLGNGSVTLQTLYCIEGSKSWGPLSDLASQG